MLKTYKLFESELDPYDEENWDNIEELKYNTLINAGDIIYWIDDYELGTVVKIDEYDNDTLWIKISQVSFDKGWAKKNGNNQPFSKRNLVNCGMKIKQI
jgi:hypothetical protein